jgi:mono/diheme cytochrome c family protein
MGPDGALYISDDWHGRIWRVTYHGDPNAQVAAAPSPKATAISAGEPGPPEGIHPEAGLMASLPVPPGATSDQVALGGRIFNGEAAGGTCLGCHGYDAKGSPQAPALVTGKWLDSDGSLSGIARTITDGVPKPKHYSVPMPARGGAPLSDSDVAAVAAYVWAVGHPAGK